MTLKRRSILVIISIYMIFGNLQNVCADSTPDLYSPHDDVIRLNSTSFIPTVFHQNKNITFVVQFYNTFCGHCQMFAPVYKDLASRIKNWTAVLRIAGVDCSKDENVITCSDNRIDGYPTILIFPPNAKAQDPEDKPLSLRSLNIEWNVDDIEDTLVDYVANLTSTRQEYPLVVEALQPIESTKQVDIRRIYPKSIDGASSSSDVQDLLFVVEAEDSYLGRKLIIEYFRIQHKLELRRILITNKELLKSMLELEDFEKLDDIQPILVRLDSDISKAKVLVRGEMKHILPASANHERLDFIQKRFKQYLENFYSVELRKFKASQTTSTGIRVKHPSQADGFNKQSDSERLNIQALMHGDTSVNKRVFYLDILKGISYMLTHEIKIKRDISPSEFNTVRNLLNILKKYLPLGKWDVQMDELIEDLKTRLDKDRSDYEKNGLSGRQFSDILELAGAEDIRSKYSQQNWISCMESEKRGKGYTCSLWLIFHSLTVGEYIKASPVRVIPKMVLMTMRDYITKFLGCTVCSLNFEKETDSLASSINNRNSSIMWLWSTHNQINQRLNNEKMAEDRKSLPEVIFPTHRLCPSCFKTSIDSLGKDDKTLEDIEWNHEAIFSYMMNTYQPDKIMSPKDVDNLLMGFEDKVEVDTRQEQRRISIVGTESSITSDISLSFILLLSWVSIYFLLLPRWPNNK